MTNRNYIKATAAASESGVGDYRFGFNGKEKDNELKGIGNSYDYGFRMYDSRVGRPFTPDPLYRKFPMLSTYQFFSNNPIKNVDLDGLEGATYEVLMWKNSSGATQINVQNDRLVGQMGYGHTGLYVNVKDEVNNISGSYYVNDVMVTAKISDSRHMGDKVGSRVQSSSWFGKAINAADKRLYAPSDQFSKWDKFEGPEGFKNHGWPTMKATTAVLGTSVVGAANMWVPGERCLQQELCMMGLGYSLAPMAQLMQLIKLVVEMDYLGVVK